MAGAATSAILDLAKGHPDPTLLPRDAIAKACAQAAADFSGGSIAGLRYGNGPRGSVAFLAELVAFLGRQCPAEAAARTDGLLLTNGVSHGLELVCSVFAQPGEVVLVEAPTYWLAVGIFQSRGLEVIPVPTDSDGILVEAAEAVLRGRPEGSPRVRFVYTVPSNHNPTGSSLPAKRRQALVDLARRWGMLVLADEVYHMLDWRPPGCRPPRMACFDESYANLKPPPDDADVDEDDDPTYSSPPPDLGQVQPAPGGNEASPPEPVVISVSSFTKILAPGLRLGWIEAAPPLIDRLAVTGYLRSGGCVAAFTADAIVGHALKSRSADEALASLVAEYRARADRLTAALEGVGLAPLVKPQGGYFVWVRLGADSKEVLEVAKEKHQVTFLPGTSYDTSICPELALCARLCFAWLQPEELEAGVGRLARAVAEVTERSR